MRNKTRILRFLVFTGYTLMICAAAASAAPPEYERTTEQLSRAIATMQDLAAQQVGGYDVVFHRDAMRPLIDAQGQRIPSAGTGGGLSIQGVIWSTEHPLAVVEDDLFPEGAVIGSYKIVEIQQDGIIVQRGNETVRVPLDRGIHTP